MPALRRAVAEESASGSILKVPSAASRQDFRIVRSSGLHMHVGNHTMILSYLLRLKRWLSSKLTTAYRKKREQVGAT